MCEHEALEDDLERITRSRVTEYDPEPMRLVDWITLTACLLVLGGVCWELGRAVA